MKKKFLSILFSVVMIFSISAQEKLREFLDRITEMTNQEMAVQSEFDLVYQSAINSLNTDTQIEMSNISNYEKYPWESELEYTTRISEEIEKLQKKRDKEIENITNEIKAEYREQQDFLGNQKQEIIKKMMQREFVYSENSVQISFGKFNTEEKFWPLVVKSLETDLNYTSSSLCWYLNKDIIAEQYKSIAKLIKTNSIKAEIYFQVIKKSLTDTYQKKVNKVILRGPDNAVLVDFPIEEIVETFTLTQVVYEPSSIVTDEVNN